MRCTLLKFIFIFYSLHLGARASECSFRSKALGPLLSKPIPLQVNEALGKDVKKFSLESFLDWKKALETQPTSALDGSVEARLAQIDHSLPYLYGDISQRRIESLETVAKLIQSRKNTPFKSQRDLAQFAAKIIAAYDTEFFTHLDPATSARFERALEKDLVDGYAQKKLIEALGTEALKQKITGPERVKKYLKKYSKMLFDGSVIASDVASVATGKYVTFLPTFNFAKASSQKFIDELATLPFSEVFSAAKAKIGNKYRQQILYNDITLAVNTVSLLWLIRTEGRKKIDDLNRQREHLQKREQESKQRQKTIDSANSILDSLEKTISTP